jgi:hypothetical protein
MLFFGPIFQTDYKNKALYGEKKNKRTVETVLYGQMNFRVFFKHEFSMGLIR